MSAFFVFVLVAVAPAQELSREQKLPKIKDLNTQIDVLVLSLLSPSEKEGAGGGFPS
jgi:hypothetical protein